MQDKAKSQYSGLHSAWTLAAYIWGNSLFILQGIFFFRKRKNRNYDLQYLHRKLNYEGKKWQELYYISCYMLRNNTSTIDLSLDSFTFLPWILKQRWKVVAILALISSNKLFIKSVPCFLFNSLPEYYFNWWNYKIYLKESASALHSEFR